MIQNNSKLVSIIIPYYNKPIEIVETLLSIENQVYKNIEVIIVDDGSSIQLEKVLKNSNFSFSLRINTLNKNFGRSYARNTAMALANGDFLAFLDADDLWFPEKLSRISSFFNGYDFIYSDCKTFNSLNSNLSLIQNKKPSNKKILKGNFINGSASSVVISRKLFLKVGNFNENLSFAEDWDYWIRCFFSTNKTIRIAETLVSIRVPNQINCDIVSNHDTEFTISKKIQSENIIFQDLILNYEQYDFKNNKISLKDIIYYNACGLIKYGYKSGIYFDNFYKTTCYFIKNYSFFNLLKFYIIILINFINIIFSAIKKRIKKNG